MAESIKRENLHIRDPFFIRENGVLYLLGTTGDDPWNNGSSLMLYKTEDLENYTEVGQMADGDLFCGYKNIWAPELHKYNGKFYLILSLFRDDLGRGSFILVSDKIEGKYKPLTGEYITPAGWWCLDATFFVYDNKPYLCFSNEWLMTVTNDGDGSLFIAELSEDLTRLVSRPKKIISGKYCGFSKPLPLGDSVGYVSEGPYLRNENGRIVLLWSTFTDGGYSMVRSVSDNGIYGDYKFDKIMYSKDGGHGMVFEGFDGKKYMTFHSPNISELERITLVEYTELNIK